MFTGGRACAVIDYIMGNNKVKDRVDKMFVGDRVDSDHHPIKIWLEGDVYGRKERGRVKKCCGV